MSKLRFLAAFLLLPSFLPNSWSTELIVDKTGSGGAYTTISAAVQNSKDGDTVTVKPGYYEEQVVISNAITLHGSGYNSTSINVPLGDTIVIISPKGATITGFWITSSSAGIHTTGVFITNKSVTLPGGNTTIQNCMLSNCGTNAIAFLGTGSLDVKNTIISNCGASGIYADASDGYFDLNGTFVQPHITVSVENSIITNNGRFGAEIISSQSSKITNCTILSNTGFGVSTNSTPLTIIGCIIGNQGHYGVCGGGKVSYSCLWKNKNGNVGNDASEGLGNIYVDPKLANNYTLLTDSPCINAGDPFPGYNDPDGSRNDIGAFGGPGAALWNEGVSDPPGNVTTPDISPVFVYSFNGTSSEENQILLIPPGNPGEYNLGDVFFRSLTTSAGDEDYTDGFGVSITLDPGEGVTCYGNPIAVEEDYVYLRIGAWTTEAGVSLALGTLDATPAENIAKASLNGSVEANILMDASRFKNKFGYLEAFYKSERGAVVPVFQAANGKDSKRVAIQFDNLEIYRIPKISLPKFSGNVSQTSIQSYFRVGDRVLSSP